VPDSPAPPTPPTPLAPPALSDPRWLSVRWHDLVLTHWEAVAWKSARILIILVAALLIRSLLNRTITRLSRVTEAAAPALLRPLRERARPDLEHPDLGTERSRQRAETIGSILRSIASFAVLGLAVMLILGELGINLAPIIASAGVVGIALGFGAQNLVKDFLSGVFMLLEDQYGVGDVIDIGDGSGTRDVSGTVEAVGLRTSRIRDVHGTLWFIRNGEIIRVGNKSQGYAQVVLDVPLAHQADLDRAGQLMKAAADELWGDQDWSARVLGKPQYLGVEQINADGVVLRLTGKTRPGEQWRVGRELRLRVKERFDAEDLQLARAGSQIFMRTDRSDDVEQTQEP
jgi:moderate conductance mechanosensitive channel